MTLLTAIFMRKFFVLIMQSLVHAALHCNNVMMMESEEDDDDDTSRRGGDRRTRSFRGALQYLFLRHNFLSTPSVKDSQVNIMSFLF